MILSSQNRFHKNPPQTYRAITIMPAAVQNKVTYASLANAIVSHGRYSHLVVMLNHTHPFWIARIAAITNTLGHSVVIVPPNHPLNLNVFYGMGAHLTERTQSQFLIYANSDVLFHEGWDRTMLDQWDEHPDKDDILTMHAYSGIAHGGGPSYRKEPGTGVLESHAPLMQAWAIRRSTKWKFDTRFDFYNTDCDFWLSAKDAGKKMMVSQESRVDHENSVCRTHFRKLPPVTSIEDSNALMKQKWGSAYHG